MDEMEEEHEFNLSDFPEEILMLICSFLNVQDVIRVGCTCTSLHALTSQDVIWRQRFRSNNDHLLTLSNPNGRKNHSGNHSSHFSNNNYLATGIWKKLYFKACFALSFGCRTSNNYGERLCAEFVSKNRENGVRFDHQAPKNMSLELWVKLNEQKPDGIIVGCQSESISSIRWPTYHWQVLHVGPDRCIRGSLEPYKFMKGPPLDDKWHHIAITASEQKQTLFVDGKAVDSIHFGIGHEYHRHYMKCSQLGNGVISHGAMTPWNDNAMPSGKCGWYPFHGLVREVRIWSGILPDSTVKQNMYRHRVDLLSHDHNCSLIGYWPLNRLVSGPWPWQGSLVSCTSHLEEHKENMSHLRTVVSALP